MSKIGNLIILTEFNTSAIQRRTICLIQNQLKEEYGELKNRLKSIELGRVSIKTL